MLTLNEQQLIQIVDTAIDKNSKILGMESRLTGVESRLTSVEVKVTENGVMLEQVRDNVNLIVEAVMPLIDKISQQEFDKTLSENSNRIAVMHQVVRDHINDRSVHVSK